MTEVEVNQPFKLVKIARNINAFNTCYEYIGEHSKFKLWSDLKNKLFKMLKTLNPREVTILRLLTHTDKQKYFAI